MHTLRDNSNFALKVECCGQVPTSLSAKAKEFHKQSKSIAEGDLIWVVFDRDEHDHVKRELDSLKAMEISVGYSNPCFELWLLYHFRDHHAPDDRNKVKKLLSEVCEGYCEKKLVLLDASEMNANLDEARARAKSGVEARASEGSELGAPSSTVYELFDSLGQ